MNHAQIPPSPCSPFSFSAILFSPNSLKATQLDSSRLASNSIGVRRARHVAGQTDAQPSSSSSLLANNRSQEEKHFDSRKSSNIDDDDDDNDEWMMPSNVIDQQGQSKTILNPNEPDESAAFVGRQQPSFQILDSNGVVQRRMTRQEKRKLKYELSQAKHLAKKEERRIKHEEQIRVAKLEKRERKRKKREKKEAKIAKRQRDTHETPDCNIDESNCGNNDIIYNYNNDRSLFNDNVRNNASVQGQEGNSTTSSLSRGDENQLQQRKGILPFMLTPAATRVALDTGALKPSILPHGFMRSLLDKELSRQWAVQLQESMVPAEKYRQQEDMRPMAYRVVPEIWTRLCPESLMITQEKSIENRDSSINCCISSSGENKRHGMEQEYLTEKNSTEVENNNIIPANNFDQQPKAPFEHSLVLLRQPSPLYDEDAYVILHHLHQYSTLHIACGARFGCDYLLYDGPREYRHSFAGLRIYPAENKYNDSMPVPSTYDLTGFVRAMNTARKLALIATVKRDSNTRNQARVAIVDLALEKILTAPTHVKKGSTEKRRSVEDTASALAKQN